MGLLGWIVACAIAGTLPGSVAVLPGKPRAVATSGTPAGVAGGSQSAARAGSAEQGSQDPYYYFVLGRHSESAGDVEAAIKAYRQAAVIDPRSAEIRAELGALFARQNRARDAIEWSEAALKLDPANVEANRVLGIVYASMARSEGAAAGPRAEQSDYAKRAVRHLEAARAKAVAPDAAMEMMLGRLYLRMGDTDRAIATLQRVVGQEPERDEPIALLVQAYQKAGRLEDAAALLEEAVAAHPEFYETLGELHESQQRWKPAAEAYEKAVAQNPRSVELKTRLAVALLSDGGSAGAGRAAAVLQEARQQSPADTQVLYLLAQAQRMAGSLDEAEKTARQLTVVAPAAFKGPYTLAQIYDAKQQYRNVIETLEPVVNKDRTPGASSTELVPLVLMLGSAYEEVGEFDQALAAFARARQIAPDQDRIDLYELATLVSARRYPQALERSAELMAAHPGDQRVARLRAEALRGTGKAAEAVTLLKEAAAENADDVTAHLALSEMHAALKQYDAAVAVLRDAGKKFPGDLTLRFQLASVLERQGRFADAERAFREVLARDPLHAPTLNYLGYMLANRGERLDESIALVKRALQAEPHNGAYLDSLGWAYFKAGRMDLAEEYLRRAADQRARDSAVQDHFGDLLFKLGRPREAAAAWRRALEGDGEQVDPGEINRKIRMAAEKAPKQ